MQSKGCASVQLYVSMRTRHVGLAPVVAVSVCDCAREIGPEYVETSLSEPASSQVGLAADIA